jgi:hypothetical protein
MGAMKFCIKGEDAYEPWITIQQVRSINVFSNNDLNPYKLLNINY